MLYQVNYQQASPVKTAVSLKSVAEKVIGFFNSQISTIFDINDVSIKLNVPKRRLYDVLNIMAPLGLVGRNGRGRYIWTGQLQPVFNFTTKDENTDKSRVRDISAKLLLFVKDVEVNKVSIASICDAVFEDKKGQLRRLYDISAVFEVLNLIKRQPKSGDFIILPLLKNMFMFKMLPPKKRAALGQITNRNDNPDIKTSPSNISPCPTLPQPTNGQLWLGATTFH